MKPKPPPERKWEEMGMYDKCTCSEYRWKTICPFQSEINEIEDCCGCCPYHSQECADDI